MNVCLNHKSTYQTRFDYNNTVSLLYLRLPYSSSFVNLPLCLYITRYIDLFSPEGSIRHLTSCFTRLNERTSSIRVSAEILPHPLSFVFKKSLLLLRLTVFVTARLPDTANQCLHSTRQTRPDLRFSAGFRS